MPIPDGPIGTLRLVPRGWMRLISTNFRGSEATEESVHYIIERLFVPTFPVRRTRTPAGGPLAQGIGR